jgi:hypothetical protein
MMEPQIRCTNEISYGGGSLYREYLGFNNNYYQSFHRTWYGTSESGVTSTDLGGIAGLRFLSEKINGWEPMVNVPAL